MFEKHEEEMLNAMMRDFTEKTPRQKSEVRKRIIDFGRLCERRGFLRGVDRAFNGGRW